MRELIDQLIQTRRNDGDSDGSDNDTNKEIDGDSDGSDNNKEIDEEFDSNIRRRLNYLVSLDSQFDKNLLNYDTIKVLANHNFYSFPSDFYNKDYDDFLNRKTEVRNLLSNYYSKLQGYADFYNESNVYSLAKLKDKYLKSKNKNLLNFLKNDINNYNKLSTYFTNLAYLEEYKISEKS